MPTIEAHEQWPPGCGARPCGRGRAPRRSGRAASRRTRPCPPRSAAIVELGMAGSAGSPPRSRRSSGSSRSSSVRAARAKPNCIFAASADSPVALATPASTKPAAASAGTIVPCANEPAPIRPTPGGEPGARDGRQRGRHRCGRQRRLLILEEDAERGRVFAQQALIGARSVLDRQALGDEVRDLESSVLRAGRRTPPCSAAPSSERSRSG